LYREFRVRQTFVFRVLALAHCGASVRPPSDWNVLGGIFSNSRQPKELLEADQILSHMAARLH